MSGVFALAPAQAIDGALDYSKTNHAKIYKAGIQQVSETPFDCEADGLFQFLKEVQDRADEMGWTTGILSITMGIEDDKEKEEDFINNYGTLTLDQVVASELQYIDGKSRYAQDTYMLYKCLMASLTSKAKKKVLIWSNQYKIGENKTSSGVALLKIIIRESHLDTNATTNQIRTNLLLKGKSVQEKEAAAKTRAKTTHAPIPLPEDLRNDDAVTTEDDALDHVVDNRNFDSRTEVDKRHGFAWVPIFFICFLAFGIEWQPPRTFGPTRIQPGWSFGCLAT
jgi:hypothetical protein